MMQFFRRSHSDYPAPVDIVLEDTWSVFEAQHGSRRLVGALRGGVSALVGHPAYRHQVGIALIVERPREDGMPDAAESQRIYGLEDTIQAELEDANQSLLVAKWFVGGCRELVFYTTDVKTMTDRLNEIARRGTRNRIQLTTNKDPDWKVLRTFAEAA